LGVVGGWNLKQNVTAGDAYNSSVKESTRGGCTRNLREREKPTLEGESAMINSELWKK